MSSPRFARAIVVGASSGLGEAIARQLASEGTHTAILARREGELKRLEKAITESGRKAKAFVHDVVDFEAVPSLFEAIEDAIGEVDLLVYAAGTMPEVTEGEYSFGKDRQMIEVNLLGAMAWMNVAAAKFEGRRKGTIAGISSIAGERGRRGNPGYCTSKAALSTYLESLRNRLDRYDVNVVTIKPGFVDTQMTKGKKGLFWLVSPTDAASQSLELASRMSGASGFVPARWSLVAFIVRSIPSFVFRKLNF